MKLTKQEQLYTMEQMFHQLNYLYNIKSTAQNPQKANQHKDKHQAKDQLSLSLLKKLYNNQSEVTTTW